MSIIAAATLVAATAALSPSEMPVDAIQSAMPRAEGRYEYRDDELVGFIDLRPDHTFEYKVEALGPPVEGEGPFRLLIQGIWRSDASGRIALTNAPTAPPIFRQTSAVRDPAVRAAIIIEATDGDAPGDLGVLTNDGENGQLNMLSDGSWIIPLMNAWDTDEGKKGTPTTLPRNWEIVRSSDDLSLVKIALTPNGPNSFTYSYTRSPIEPFHLAAQLIENVPGAIEVEFGTASITMHKNALGRVAPTRQGALSAIAKMPGPSNFSVADLVGGTDSSSAGRRH